ncbi:ATP-binding protein [Methylolobus aquaticus]
MSTRTNSPRPRASATTPALHELFLAALAPTAGETGNESAWLKQCFELCHGNPVAALTQRLQNPTVQDERILGLAAHFRLGLSEIIAVTLAVAVEREALPGRVLAWLQAPVASSRPSLGLISSLAPCFGLTDPIEEICEGEARACGLLRFDSDTRPLPETCIQVPVPIVLALGERQRPLRHIHGWPNVRVADGALPPLAESMRVEAARQAHALTHSRALVVRSGQPREARAACALMAHDLGGTAVFVDGELPTGMGPWAWLTGAVPVICSELAPGESLVLPKLYGYEGPLLVAAGPEGSFVLDGDPVGSWRVGLPAPQERVLLWREHVDDQTLAETLGRDFRCGASNINLIGRAASHHARLTGADGIAREHVVHAARQGLACDLGRLAELLPDAIGDEALVLTPLLRTELLALRQRCLSREGLADPLGPSARTRYKPGVRALFVGASGTGKTLAAGWLASELGLPLYRVDVAATTSKYIGETEKNLAQLFARAEHMEVILLFDEADSLFGKRTDVKESNDRFANQQTNYLLQRIESFEGIALLTSNSRSRFDSAFSRRLDAVLEFPLPTPEERRRLWLAHLGSGHELDARTLNRLAANCELSGGHVRNIVLSAAVAARAAQRPIQYNDLLEAVAAEYRKLGKQTPGGLGPREAPAWA